MNPFRHREWSFLGVIYLRLSSVIIGLIAGVYLAEYLKGYVWLFALVGLLLILVRC